MSPDRMNAFELPLNASVSMAFRRIPPGEFWMGSRGYAANEEPMHRVHVTSEFYLGATPVTQEQFRVWTASEAYRAWLDGARSRSEARDAHTNYFRETPCARLPADSVTWFEAVGYMEWLNGVVAMECEPSGLRACLPTEAQWEYACRAGTRSEYWNGDGEAALAEMGWYQGNSGGKTHPVGKKLANPWGLYDMNGNVWEWLADVWSSTIYGKRSDSIQNPIVTEEEGDLAEYDSGVVRISGWITALELLGAGELPTAPHEDSRLREAYEYAIRMSRIECPRYWVDIERILKDAFEFGAFSDAEVVREIVSGLRLDYLPTAAGSRHRTVRGGAWIVPAAFCRSARRSRGRPEQGNWVQGFRVCLISSGHIN